MTATSDTILIVDDDPAITASLSLLLKQVRYRPETAASPDEALRRIDGGGVRLVLQDMNFSRLTTGDEGLDLLRLIKARRPELPVILMTAWGSIALAVKGMQAGASDFVTKPWTNQQLLGSVKTILGLAAATPHGETAGTRTREELDALYDFQDIAGREPKLLRVLDIVGRVSATDASVLITGESGTGKEIVAEAIHRNSPRRNGPFLKVNLGGVPASLFESEMFGHVKGAFTDARQDRKGRFELAAGGSILLDEVGDLDLSSQVKMLRVLQDRTYEVLGSSVTRTVDVRVISATNRKLEEAVARGEFREDLLYRLNLITVHLPPLRERPADIPLLAARFLATIGRVYGKDGLSVSDDGFAWLQSQPWPGNVRQFRHLIERTILLGGRATIRAEDFLQTVQADTSGPRRDLLPEVGSMTIEEMEKAMILKSLKHHGGNIRRVADSLGMSRAALYRRLEKYGIEI